MKPKRYIPLLAIALCLSSAVVAEDANPLQIEATLFTKEVTAVAAGETVVVRVTVSTQGKEKYRFSIGSFAERFGVYILGPWGPVLPDGPRDWMQMGPGGLASNIIIERGKPFTRTFRISEYFDVRAFRPGKYQMNIKFYARELGLPSPIDSGPIVFTVKG